MVLNFCVAKYFSWAAITHKIFLQLSVSQTTVCMYYWQISEHLSYTNSDLKVKFLLWFQPWFPRILMNTNKVIQQVPVSASKLCLFDIVYCLLFAVKNLHVFRRLLYNCRSFVVWNSESFSLRIISNIQYR